MGNALGRPLATEFELECGTTRQLLERVPDGHVGWQPHERSMSLGRLASHVVEVVRYGSLVLETDRLDSARRVQGPLELTSSREMIERLEAYAQAFRSALDAADDARLLESWSYCKGERVIFETRRIHALRTFVFNHLYHHRGQLTVYLRMLDIPLPQVYGPSADDASGY